MNEYQPLKKDEIRLLEVLPHESGSMEIKVKLRNVGINSAYHYRALSYTWGNPQPARNIICDGRVMNVTDNLWNALYSLQPVKQRFAFRSHRKLFWIDAICINQNDNLEKSIQVMMMPSIYAQASKTDIWLGRKEPFSGEAFQLISELAKTRRTAFDSNKRSMLDQKPTNAALNNYRKLLPRKEHRGWIGLNELLRRVYFDRAWIIQDIICSKEPIVRCSELKTTWEEFSYALEGYLCYSFPSLVTVPGARMVLDVEYARRHLHLQDNLSLDKMLDLIRPLKSTDLRDKVYAATSIFLGLKLQITTIAAPDYGRSVDETYMDVAFALNSLPELGGYFCGLSMVEDSGSRRPDTSTLPSWAPDWTAQRQIYRLNTKDSRFDASKGASASRIVTSARRTLTFNGCIVDTLASAPHYLPSRRFYDKYSASGDNSIFFSYWFDLARTNGQARYKNENERILDWAETVQAKGCELWQEREPHDPADLILQTRTWLDYLEDEEHEEKTTEDIRQYYAACLPAHGRKFGITRRGHFCLVPRFADAGDRICIPFGSKVPFVFRATGEEYLNIGECYVQGAMQGEALAWENVHDTEFVLR